jgi:serine/threonine-protein kinase
VNEDSAPATTCPFCGGRQSTYGKYCSYCGRSPAGFLRPGTVIGSRYEVLVILGRGGMGTVYKAHDRTLDEDLALKVLRSDIGDSPALNQRFLAEIKLARRVSHPNVCRIHEYGEHGDLRYISMEFVSGTDLREVLQQGALPAAEAMEASIQVASGLEAIHSAGIIHRDLKTPNIMRDHRGQVRLMDFGIAKQWDLWGGVTTTGQLVGTPEYMSPEQARGEMVDFRSDIYALGIVLFELFTGRVPFTADSPLAALYKHIKDPPPLEGPEAARIPDAVTPILAKMLQKDPAARYATAGEVAADLWNARAQVQSDAAAAEARASKEDTVRIPIAAPPALAPSQGAPAPSPARTMSPPPLPGRLTPPPVSRAETPPPGPRVPTPPPQRLTAVRPGPGSEAPAAEGDQWFDASTPERRTEVRAALPDPPPLPPSDSQRLKTPARPRGAPAPAQAVEAPTVGEQAARVSGAVGMPPPTTRFCEDRRARSGLAPTVSVLMGAAAALIGLAATLVWFSTRPESPAARPTEAQASPSPTLHPAPTQPTPPATTPSPPRRGAGPAPAPSPRPREATPTARPPEAPAPTPSPRLLVPAALLRPTPEPPPTPAASSDSSAPFSSSPLWSVRTEPVPAPTPFGPPAANETGTFRLAVKPWARVLITGHSASSGLPFQLETTTPVHPFSLEAGAYTVRFLHPDYHPLQRNVTIRPGEIARLDVDLAREAFRSSSPLSSVRAERVPAPTPFGPPAAEETGTFCLGVNPWARVLITGHSASSGLPFQIEMTTPVRPFSLEAGTYAVRLVHPDYHPLQRKVTIRPGEVVRLDVDLTREAFPSTSR